MGTTLRYVSVFIQLRIRSKCLGMSIRSYFQVVKQQSVDVPDLEKLVPVSMAEAVNKETKRATEEEAGGSKERKRGAYEKITPENKAKIAKYALP